MAKKNNKIDVFEQVSKNVTDVLRVKIDELLETVIEPDPSLLQEASLLIQDSGVDWSQSMGQTYEFYIVDPDTWADDTKLENVESCTITRDASDETKGTAQITSEDDLSDKYVRCYLIATQNSFTYKIPLGTYMYQAPGFKYNGKRQIVDQDGYTPLIELKENMPPIGYALPKRRVIMEDAYNIMREHMRAPITKSDSTAKLSTNFVSDVDDTWLSFLTDLIANAKYEFAVDAMGRICFEPIKDTNSLYPVYTYNDDNSSILYPEVQMQRDLYGVPNVVEVVYSPSNGVPISARAVNKVKSSIISTVARGREVVYRETSPDVEDGVTVDDLKQYATTLLRNMSSYEFEVTYTHGYCPVEVGDCVELNYVRAGIVGVRARVTRQVIKCEPGCPVEETAVFTQQLWKE